MSLIRRLARPMLAAPFVYEGVRTALHPEREIDVAPAAFAQVDKALENSSMPRAIDAAAIVRATGVVAAGAGVLYGMGRAPRVTSLLLLATTSVAAYLGLGGLGRYLFDALAVRDYTTMLAGAVLIAVLALAADALLLLAQRLVTPRGLRPDTPA